MVMGDQIMAWQGQVLVIDTHATSSLVAGGVRGELLCHCQGAYPRRPLADLGECVANVESAIGEVSGLGVVVGPGGLLSVRAGVAFARAYASLRRIPLARISTFLAVARSLPEDFQDVVVVEPAGRGEVAFVKIGGGDGEVGRVVVADPLNFSVANVLVAGSGADKVGEQSVCPMPSANGLIRACFEVLDGGGGKHPDQIAPSYLRPPDARRSFEVRNPDGTFSWVKD